MTERDSGKRRRVVSWESPEQMRRIGKCTVLEKPKDCSVLFEVVNSMLIVYPLVNSWPLLFSRALSTCIARRRKRQVKISIGLCVDSSGRHKRILLNPSSNRALESRKWSSSSFICGFQVAFTRLDVRLRLNPSLNPLFQIQCSF